MTEPQWLRWARELQAQAQSGLAYTRNPYEMERYRAIRDVAAEILAHYSQVDTQTIRTLLEGEAGYATPKVDTRGVVFQDDALLLVKERADGNWTLPGGWADVGESPSEAVVREIVEESGYQARAVKLLAVYDRNRHGHPPFIFHIYKLFFRCELTGGAAATTLETDGVAFFREDALPALSLPRVTPEQIHRLFEHYRHPEWPTDFD